MIRMRSMPGRQAFVLTVLALVWSGGLLAAALFAPVYGSATLVAENGRAVLLVVAVPAVLSVVVWLALWRRCTRGGRVSGFVAWLCVGILAAFCVVGILSIGVFVVPVAVLLARAAAITPLGPARGPAGA